jgi:hypothetical protein
MCKYSHNETVIQAAHDRYGTNIKKFFETAKQRYSRSSSSESLQNLEEESELADPMLQQELCDLAIAQGYDDSSMSVLAESFCSISLPVNFDIEAFNSMKQLLAPNAAAKGFSAVHMQGRVLVGVKGDKHQYVPLSNILLDTGAIHGSYISLALFEKWSKDGLVLRSVAVSPNECVRLGDGKTMVPLHSRVYVPVEFKDAFTGKIYTATVL